MSEALRQCLLSKGPRIKRLDIEGMESLYVRTWTLAEEIHWSELVSAKSSDVFAFMVIYSVCDEQGKNLFTIDDLEAVTKLPADVVGALLDAIRQHNAEAAPQKKVPTAA